MVVHIISTWLINKIKFSRGWSSLAKYCAKNLPITTEVLAFHNGKVVFKRSATSDSSGLLRDPKPSIYLSKTPTSRDGQSEFGDSELSEIGRNSQEGISSCEDGWRESKYEELGSFERHRKSLSAFSTSTDLVQQRPGWPLLRTASVASPPIHEARKMSVVSWVMSLPNRSSSPGTPGSIRSRWRRLIRSIVMDRSTTLSLVLKSSILDPFKPILPASFRKKLHIK